MNRVKAGGLNDAAWAAAGIKPADADGRTAPTALNAQEIDLYVALPSGLYLYQPLSNVLELMIASDVRRVTGYQDFVDDAPLDIIYVADHARMRLVGAAMRESYAWFAAGAITENIYLYSASVGLSTVVRAWIDRSALTTAMGLDADHQVLVSQTVGYPKTPFRAV